jgi:lipopolysaccharide transport system ATP-binding protein
MSDTVITVENLYKEYKLGVISHGTLYRDLQSWWARVRGKEDPNSLISMHHSQQTEEGNFLALKDISFEVKAGDRVGIIGKNGAGKSTLLKILSRITSPTRGTVKIKGRVGSLLEVGTGFHSELTGRENIYLNGAILGMNRYEIFRKLDEIVNFAGIEKYLDTPVKRYSSGMNVRLGFAVAAHLDTDILIADEVLAVGDAEFQKKAIGKMQDISTGEGRTILFVSHNMGAVRNLCEKGVVLQNGGIILNNSIDNAIEVYLHEVPAMEINSRESMKAAIANLPSDPSFKLFDVKLMQKGKEIFTQASNAIPLEIEIRYEVLKKEKGLRVCFDLCDYMGDIIFRSFHDEDNDGIPTMEPGKYVSKVIIPGNLLGSTNYEIVIGVSIFNVRSCVGDGIRIPMSISNLSPYNRAYTEDTFRGKLGMVLRWHNTALDVL